MASRSWNKVELIGNLTRDPELRFTPSGAAVCTFGLATNRSYLVDGQRKEEVDFHRLVAWNKLAELCNQLLKKGAKVFIAGRLQYREWEGQDGNKRRDAEIVIEDMILITPKSSSSFEETSHEESAGEAVAEEAGKVKVAPKKAKEASENKSNSPDENVPADDLPF